MPDLAPRIAALCREMERGDLQTIVATIGAENILHRILAALVPGADTTALGDDLDALDAKLIGYGIPGGLLPPARRVYQPTPAAAGELHPAITVWACPTGRCNRWLPIDPATGEGPVCTVQGVPLVKQRISA